MAASMNRRRNRNPSDIYLGRDSQVKVGHRSAFFCAHTPSPCRRAKLGGGTPRLSPHALRADLVGQCGFSLASEAWTNAVRTSWMVHGPFDLMRWV